MNKVIYLTGIPGSGKTTVAGDLKKEDFQYIGIDDFYKSVKRVDKSVEWFRDLEYMAKVYEEYESSIFNNLKNSNLVLESSGIGDSFQKITNKLESRNINFKIVYLKIDPEVARNRVKTRNESDYEIKLSAEDMDFYTSQIHKIEEFYDFKVDAILPSELIVEQVLDFVM